MLTTIWGAHMAEEQRNDVWRAVELAKQWELKVVFFMGIVVGVGFGILIQAAIAI